MRLSRAFGVLLAAAVGLAAGIPLSYATFNPVGQDIDIFLANPAITAERPNVLIMLDNTANWNLPFTNEKSALVTVVNSLSSDFNVGLMMYNESGQPVNHGSYVRFGVRQMTTANKTALATLVNNLDILGDKGNNNTISELIYEAYLYWAGLTCSNTGTGTDGTGCGQAKRDFPNNTAFDPLANPPNANPPNGVLNSNTPSTYVSPITSGCQKNFQIYISNGPANENAATLSRMQGALSLLTGQNPPSVITLSNVAPDSNSQQQDWMDEFARFMANNDCNANFTGVQTVITYVLEIDPTTTGQGPGMTTLMKSVASNGKGEYFATSSANGGAQIIAALNQIFSEIQAKNTVFASSTLPVSVNVRGTNLNQVYIGVFRPDANKAPRWLGNLKLYDLAVNSATNTLFLADANGNPAADPTTGFTKNTALSFWTTPSNFWSFESPFQSTNIGQASDSPDGDLVEKGGVGEQLRNTYETDQTTRKLYTCTAMGGCPCSGNSCSTPVALSGSPFTTANSDITAIALGTLLTVPVSTLSSVGTLATASTGTTPHGFSSGNTVVIAGASPSVYNGTFTITSVPSSTTFTYTLPSSPSGNTATASATANGLGAGDRVLVCGSTQPGYNTDNVNSCPSVAITTTGNDQPATVVDANTFNYSLSAAVTTPSSGQTVVGRKLVQNLSAIGTTATVTMSAPHGYSTGNLITITGASPTTFDVANAAITVTGASTFTYTTPIFTGTSSTAQGTTVSPHNLSTGNTVTINCATPLAYNATAVVTVIDATNFQYTLSSPQGVDASFTTAPSGCSGATNITVTKSGITVNASSVTTTDPSTVTVSTGTTAHGFRAGDQITIAGVSPTLFDVTTTVASVPTPTSLTYTLTIPAVGGQASPATTSGTITATVGSSTVTVGVGKMTHGSGGGANTVTVNTGTTSPPAAFVVGATVVVTGATQSAYNGTFKIASVTTTGSNRGFTYVTGLLSGVPTPTGSSITVSGSITRFIANTCGSGTSACLQRTFVASGTIYSGKTISINSITSQTNATGSITAANQNAGDPVGRANLIAWVRGQDNAVDEDVDTSATDVRASVHGDVLHSQPAVINYNRNGANGSNTGDNDVVAFYGSNDGVFHAVQGGFTSVPGSTCISNPTMGGCELWGFIAPEFFGTLNRQRVDTPLIGQPSGTSSPRDYFFDGPIGVYTVDVNSDGKLLASDGDKAYLFVTMRRGGRYIYAFDVSDPANPKFMWKRGCPNMYNADGTNNTTGCDSGFSELGQTWSAPKVGFLRAYSNPVLFFGAGYDPAVEDYQPCLITAMDASSVTAQTGGTVTFTSSGSCTFTGTTTTKTNRTMGRGVFIVDAITGNLLFRFGPDKFANIQVSGMNYAIPADLVVLNRDGDNTRTLPGIENIQPQLKGFVDRIYAVDTGGNVWRMDVDSANTINWVVTQLASLSGSSLSDKRKFLFPPDVVLTSDANGPFDAVLLGTGDREHPFDATVTNRFYMLKDRATGLYANPSDPTIPINDGTYDATIDPNGLADVTNNCLQDPTVCPTGSTQQLQAQANLLAARGWKLTFGAGEKDVGSATTQASTTFFNTNQPTGSAGSTDCTSNLGVARQYAINFLNATVPPPPPGVVQNLTATGRATVVEGGGYLPSPVPLIVEIGGKPYQAVISGTQIQSPGGLTLGSRIRTYWYRKLE